MKKILFDTSIHLGQFCTNDESIRIACKNSQISLSAKTKNLNIGVITFNENSWADDIIWSLDQKTQSVFYKFMDTFHSVKNIQRVPLNSKDMALALKIAQELKIDSSNALSCAVAITQKVDDVHTIYPDLLKQKVRQFMKKNYNIKIIRPKTSGQINYAEKNLEKYYTDALKKFTKKNINLVGRLHT